MDPAPAADALRIDELTVSRAGSPVLREVQLELPSGVTALLGRNGAGKTTLLRALCGLQSATVRRVRYQGHDPFRDERARRDFMAKLGFMPQDPQFPHGVRVGEAVEYAAWLKGAAGATARRAAAEALEDVDMLALSNRPAHRLSGGERRRTALACTIVGRPQVLLLDEPTVGLDPEQRDNLLRTIALRADHAIVLLSTHLVEDVLQLADRVAVLRERRIST